MNEAQRNERRLDRPVMRRSLTELLRLGPYMRDGKETRATMEEAADEIERLRAEVGRLLDSREDEAERLDWLLARLPGSVIRDLVGVMSNTRDSGEWRALIDKAAGFKPHNMGLTGDHRMLRAICRHLGYLDPIRAVVYEGIADEQLLELVAAVHSETGDVSRSLVAALADGRVTQREFESFDEQTIEAMTALAELRDRLRGMVVEDPVRLRKV